MNIIQNKNTSIAKMLNWKYDELSETFQTTFLELIEPQSFGDDQFSSKLKNFELKFHSDYNWMFEAIDWIEKNTKYFFYSIVHSVGFETTGYRASSIVEVNSFNRKEAIFEALYQFSLYLKQ